MVDVASCSDVDVSSVSSISSWTVDAMGWIRLSSSSVTRANFDTGRLMYRKGETLRSRVRLPDGLNDRLGLAVRLGEGD